MQNLIRYYNACYQADTNSLIVSNFFSSVENKLLIEEEELLNGFLPYYPIDEEKSISIKKDLTLFAKEKELVYCSLFVIGQGTGFAKKSKICSPLLVYSAEIIEEDENYFIKIDRETGRINYALLKKVSEGSDENAVLFDELFSLIQNQIIDEKKIFEIINVLNKYLPNLDTEDLILYPNLFDKKKIDTLLKAKINKKFDHKIIPASGFGIIKKSINTRGIINELDQIAETNNFSSSLEAAFTNKSFPKKASQKIGRLPSILSNPQQKILQNAAKFPISLVVGPPGTGKSYTISALAIEQMSKGKSILIASRTDKAVDVIADKIENQLGIKGLIIRGGRSEYLRDLKHYLQNILSGNIKAVEGITSSVFDKELNKLEKEIQKLETNFNKRVKNELAWGKYFIEGQSGFFSDLKKKYIVWRNNSLKSHFEIITKLDIILQIHQQKTVDYIQKKYSEQIENSLETNRSTLQELLKALRARRGVELEKRFRQADFKKILKTFPIWLVKMSDIHRVLPLTKGLFDIAIIDEATQCDMASSIPIMQRAKHSILTGDPAQLRHISFLSKARMQNLAQKFNLENENEDLLDYRNNSILDIVSNNLKSQEQVSFLNEHYRSLPSIIKFSNQKFYNGNLKIMSNRPDITHAEGIELVYCGGERSKQGKNQKEAEFIIDKISEIITNELDLAEEICRSIGVLSPFSSQVELLDDLIKKTFALKEIERHKLQVSTAYGFQGDERDIMLLSFALDNNSHSAAFRHINKHDVFNVSITRAKSMQYICHSLDIKTLKTNSILREYFQSIEGYQNQSYQNQEKDKFMLQVIQELNKLGVKTWEAFPVAGLKIDIIMQKSTRIFGIDLIGYPSEFMEAFSLERYKMLQRAGLKTVPLAYTYWMTDKEKCINELMDLFW